MTLRELRYLVAIAEHRHFGRAADACHVTQPTLSSQLRKLEGYLGQTLIDRQLRQPTLTLVGERVAERARRLLDEADQILSLTRQRSSPLEGAVGLGIIPTLAPFYLPDMLPPLRERFSRLHLMVCEDLTEHLCAKLEQGLLDVALLALPAPLPPEQWQTIPLFDEPFWVACPPGHAMEAQTLAEPCMLEDQPLLLLTDGHCLRGQALEACRRGDAADEALADYRATSLETLCQLVSAGHGCTLLPALAARHRSPERLVVRPLSGGESRRIGLVWRRCHARSAELGLLAEALRQTLPDGVQPVDAALRH